MDLIIIGLIVLIFLVLYGLYYFLQSAALTKGMVLLTKKETINYEKIDVAGSSIYYDGWIFIMSVPSEAKPIVAREITISVQNTANGPAFIVGPGVGDTTSTHITITSDLPLQKWVHFAVRYKESILEAYLNGKLIKTAHYPDLMNYSKTGDLEVGGAVNGYLTKLRRLTEPLDSNRIWESYLEGNGQFSGTIGYLFNYIDSYNAKIKISKNDVTQREMSLF